jgi:hypothetical protein
VWVSSFRARFRHTKAPYNEREYEDKDDENGDE